MELPRPSRRHVDNIIPYVFDRLAMARLSRATYSLMVSLLPAMASRDRPRRARADLVQHWFLTEQREEVSSKSALLAVVERAAETNLLLVEDYLARTAVRDHPRQGHQHPRQPAAPTSRCGDRSSKTRARSGSRSALDTHLGQEDDRGRAHGS